VRLKCYAILIELGCDLCGLLFFTNQKGAKQENANNNFLVLPLEESCALCLQSEQNFIIQFLKP